MPNFLLSIRGDRSTQSLFHFVRIPKPGLEEKTTMDQVLRTQKCRYFWIKYRHLSRNFVRSSRREPIFHKLGKPVCLHALPFRWHCIRCCTWRTFPSLLRLLQQVTWLRSWYQELTTSSPLQQKGQVIRQEFFESQFT